MLIKKRHRQRVIKMAQKFNTKTKSEIIEKDQSNNKEIDGLYYDKELNRYFPTKNNLMDSFSDYIKKQNKRLVINKNNEIIINIDAPQTESMFNLIKSFKINTKSYLKQNKKFLEIKDNFIANNIKIEKIKMKFHLCDYCLFSYQDKSFMITLDNTENHSHLMIEEIINFNNQFETIKVRDIFLKYFDKKCEKIKAFDNWILIYFQKEIFFICIENIFNTKNIDIFLFNFQKYFQSMLKMPLTYEWPIIKKIENNEYGLLFYKKFL